MSRLTALTLALVLAAGTAGCGVARGDDAELTIYSGRSEELVGPLLAQFNSSTGIPIAVRYGSTSEIALLIAEEGAGSPADVFLSQSPGATGFLLREGLLADIEAEQLQAVPERFRSPDGRWVGVTARQRVLVYNSDMVDEADLPDSVMGVTQPPYAGRVAVAPTNGSFQDFVTAMRQVEGEEATLEWLTALADGGAPTYANNNAIVEAVSRGEVPMGLVNHYYNARFLAEDPDLPSRNHVFPGGDLGALLLETTASIMATTDQRGDAEAFVEFLLSEDAQRYFAEQTFEYPLAAGVQAPAGLPPLDTLEVPNVDLAELGEGLERTTELIRDSGLEQS